MRTGISTACLYPMESEKSLQQLISYGYKHFEFFVNSYYEMQPAFIAEFKKILSDSGSTVKAIHPFTSLSESMLFFDNYERRFTDGLDFYKHYFETACQLGAEIFVLHGQGLQRNNRGFLLSDAEYCERFFCISEAAKAFGVNLCQENVYHHRSGSSQFLRAMRDLLGETATFVFDIKQCLLCGENPINMINTMGNAIRHIHLSDSKQGSPCLLPGAGSFDFSAVVQALKNNQYDGSIITEVYSSSYQRQKELETARLFTEKLFAT